MESVFFTAEETEEKGLGSLLRGSDKREEEIMSAEKIYLFRPKIARDIFSLSLSLFLSCCVEGLTES